jgi:hypothetical protein
MGSFPNDEGVTNLKCEESSSSRTSRSASSERSTSWSTPSTQDGQYTPAIYSYEHRHDSAHFFPSTSNFVTLEGSPPSSENDAAYELESTGWSEPRVAGRILEYPDAEQIDAVPLPSENPQPTVVYPVASVAAIQALSGLTNMRPSRYRTISPFEERLDNRINRLWGNYKTFANASSKGLGVTPLFGRTLSELFRQSRQMAENVCCR